MHGGAAAREQNGEGFRGQGDSQMEHGGQDESYHPLSRCPGRSSQR